MFISLSVYTFCKKSPIPLLQEDSLSRREKIILVADVALVLILFLAAVFTALGLNGYLGAFGQGIACLKTIGVLALAGTATIISLTTFIFFFLILHVRNKNFQKKLLEEENKEKKEEEWRKFSKEVKHLTSVGIEYIIKRGQEERLRRRSS